MQLSLSQRPSSPPRPSASSAATSTKQSRRRQARLVQRLHSSGPQRREYLSTPGPYPVEDSRESHKIPYVFRTSDRFPRLPPPPKDAIDVDQSVVEPKPRIAVFSSDERWKRVRAVTSEVRVYDVERGLRAVEPKTFCATFNAGERKLSPTRAPPASAAELEPGESPKREGRPATSMSASLRGPVIARGGERNTLESFILRCESPGPIYNPSYRQVEPAQMCTVFSAQARLPTPAPCGPSALQYADCVAQERHLSTRERSPTVIFASAPPSTAMPFPFNVHNICNSRSMRTAFCAAAAAPPAVGASDSVRRTTSKRGADWETNATTGTTTTTSSGSHCRHRLRRVLAAVRPVSAGDEPTRAEQATQAWVRRHRAVAEASRHPSSEDSVVDSIASPFHTRLDSPRLRISQAALALDDGSSFDGKGHAAPTRASSTAGDSVRRVVRGGGFALDAYKPRPTSAAAGSGRCVARHRDECATSTSQHDDAPSSDVTIGEMNTRRDEAPAAAGAGKRFSFAPKYPLKFDSDDEERYFSPHYLRAAIASAFGRRPVQQHWRSVSVPAKLPEAKQ